MSCSQHTISRSPPLAGDSPPWAIPARIVARDIRRHALPHGGLHKSSRPASAPGHRLNRWWAVVHQLLGLLLAVHLPAAIVPRYACEGFG
jgi:hypothetical protein